MLIEDIKSHEKWCPFVRLVESIEDGASNRHIDNYGSEEACGCLGSDCACWIPTQTGLGYCGLTD